MPHVYFYVGRMLEEIFDSRILPRICHAPRLFYMGPAPKEIFASRTSHHVRHAPVYSYVGPAPKNSSILEFFTRCAMPHALRPLRDLLAKQA